jgi:YHS domain-containing protein
MNARYLICAAGILTAITASTFVARPLNLVAQSDSQAAASQKVEAQQQGKAKSATLQHLERLYSKAGKRMPPMQIRQLPSTAPAATKASRGRDLSKRPSPPTRSRNPFAKLFSFVKRLPKKEAAAKPSPTPTNDRRSITPSTAQTLRATAGKRMAERQKPGLLPQVLRRPQQQQLQTNPPRPEMPRTKSAGSITTAASPSNYRRAVPREPAVAEKNTIRQANSQIDEFPDLFPDVSEEEADRLLKRARRRQRAQVAFRRIPATTPVSAAATTSEAETTDDTPSSEEETGGEVLASEDSSPASENEAAKADDGISPNSIPIAAIETESGDGESSGEAKTDVVDENSNTKENRRPKSVGDLPATASVAATPDTTSETMPKTAPDAGDKDEHSAKLQKIAARTGKTGLKGFCPVVLRDERELTDTKPEFSSTYNSKTYQLSSAAAKVKFDANPTSYVPVSNGNDVVLLDADEEAVEGTLDYAVWYRDRMYLFSNEETMRTFSHAPAKYTPSGDEKQTFPDDLPE